MFPVTFYQKPAFRGPVFRDLCLQNHFLGTFVYRDLCLQCLLLGTQDHILGYSVYRNHFKDIRPMHPGSYVSSYFIRTLCFQGPFLGTSVYSDLFKDPIFPGTFFLGLYVYSTSAFRALCFPDIFLGPCVQGPGCFQGPIVTDTFLQDLCLQDPFIGLCISRDHFSRAHYFLGPLVSILQVHVGLIYKTIQILQDYILSKQTINCTCMSINDKK